MEALTLIAIGVMTVLLVVVLFVLLKRSQSSEAINPDKLIKTLYEKSEELREKNKNEVNSTVKDMLEGNQKSIDLIVRELQNQLKVSQTDVKSLKEQNAGLKQAISDTNQMTKELKISTDSLKNLLSNNRLRGEWGEQVAEDLLLAAGFVQGKTYAKQSKTAEGRPDYTVLLPDGSRLNIDVKFPYDGLVEYQEAKTAVEKKSSLKKFENAIKDKVKTITSKDYINPEDQTLDFVVMFIPNEMIFSFIYEKLPAINDYCAQRRVVMAGPFGFTALLRLVMQAYKNFQYEKGLQQILGLIEKFRGEYDKFGESLQKLGRQIETTHATFNEVEGTRSRKLSSVVDKITEYSHQEKLTETSDEGRLIVEENKK